MGSCGTCNTKDNKTVKGCKNHGTCGTDGCNKLTIFDWLSDVNVPNDTDFKYIEVRFKNDRKAIYKNIYNLNLQIGDIVAVESSPGHDIGIISLKGALVDIQARKKSVNLEETKIIYRLANQKDIDVWTQFREQEYQIMINARSIAKKLNLVMKIADVEYQGDGSKATFYYTAEGRIDFRELIKQLATSFKTKIDMRQIGYRQESAKVGGIGSCGRELCCSSWLTDFRSVNTAAARYQQLSINPQKLAGQCGKLKCCLNFELDSYLEAINDFPNQLTVLKTEKGKAHCLKIDVFRRKMWFVYSDNSVNWFDFSIEEIQDFITKNNNQEILPALEELKRNNYEIPLIDIIEENNINRFENKRKKKKTKNNKKISNNSDNKIENSLDINTENKTEVEKNKKKIINKKVVLNQNPKQEQNKEIIEVKNNPKVIRSNQNKENKQIPINNTKKIIPKKNIIKNPESNKN